MTEYCKQCSIKNFTRDYGDFVGLVSKKEAEDGFFGHVFCTGCGETLVDETGKCIAAHCVEHGLLAGQ